MIDIQQLADLALRHGADLKAEVHSFELRGERFDPWPEGALMGVVNLSADSWYRESVVLSVEDAVRRGRRLAVEGARIIDVGAESTILDAARVDAATQTSRLLPVVRELNDSGILVSVETYHPDVTEACLDAGAAVVNLTSAADTFRFYRMAAEHQAGVIVCYVQNGPNVRDVGDFETGSDHSALLRDYFAREIDRAITAGVSRIWIDPGLGFYYRNLQDSRTRVRYQLETFLNTFRLRSLGWPVCHALPHAFEFFGEEVRTAEPFFAVMALLGRTDLLRTHEVAKVRGVMDSLKTL